MVTSFLRRAAIGALALLGLGCGSPTEPSGPPGPSLGFGNMSLVQCESDRKDFGSPDFQFTQTGRTFDMKIAGVGKAHGTLSDDVWGTFTITLDPPCTGSGSGLFQLSGSSHGPYTSWTASGSWNATITESGPGCACPVGPAYARFTLG